MNKDDVAGLVERLRRKKQKLPAMGSGFMSVDDKGNVTSGSHIYDDGKRLVNPDGPEAADALTTLSASVEALEAFKGAAWEALVYISEASECELSRNAAKEALAGDTNHG